MNVEPIQHHDQLPALLAMQNSLRKLREIGDETRNLGELLNEHLEAIREHASRESVNRA